MRTLLTQLYNEKKIRAIDLYFSQFINELHDGTERQTETNLILYISCLLSSQQSQGHSCLALELIEKQNVLQLNKTQLNQLATLLPAPSQWITLLQTSNCVSDGATATPFVLISNRIYLYRYWFYEKEIAQSIKQRLQQQPFMYEKMKLMLPPLLNHYFKSTITQNSHEVDWQKVATGVALTSCFSVITGGPGTGKTTTVIKLLACYQNLFVDRHQSQPIIKIIAPTGKAAQRLSSSIHETLINQKENYQDLACLMSQNGQTIHRLLGYNSNTAQCYYNSKNQLAIDLVIVDEASMIDLNLFYHLLQALPAQSKLILLGDPLQLTSVETGSVLSNICEFHRLGYSEQQRHFLTAVTGYSTKQLQMNVTKIMPNSNPSNQRLSDQIATLYKSYRFDQNSVIGQLAQLLQQDHLDMPQLIALSKEENHLYFQWFKPEQKSYDQFIYYVSSQYHNYFNLIKQESPVEIILAQFNKIRLLVALREGDFGIKGVNRHIETVLQNQHFINTNHYENKQDWYLGRPIMITENDYQLGLSNGDIGITLVDPQSGHFRIYFEDYRQPSVSLITARSLSPSQLPAHETCYAMTIHKSQGSEFEHTMIMLPEKMSQLLSKELLYTGVTRAKTKLTLYASEKIIDYTLKQQIKRNSGLFSMLAQENEIKLE